MALLGHAVDNAAEVGDVAVHVQIVRLRFTTHGVQPADFVGIGADDAGILFQVGVATGEVALRNVQPLFAELEDGGIAIAHNGNFTNGLTLRRQIIATGAIQ